MKSKLIILVLIFIASFAFVFVAINRTKVPKNKEEAVKIIQNKIKAMNSSKNEAQNPCIVYFSSEKQDYFQVEIRERHGDKICPGAFKNFTLMAMYRINKKTGAITWYDIINDRFISWEEFVRSLSYDDLTKIKNSNVMTFDKYWRNNSFKIIIARGKDCASCHQNEIFVFDDKGKIIFQTDTSDALIGEITNDSFQIKETPSGSTESRIRTFYWTDDKVVERN
ncbi:MAG: hypothetical protein V1922_04920 [bacterium]